MTPDRVIAALVKDPALAWGVRNNLCVLGPWRQTTKGIVRYCPDGSRGAVLRMSLNTPEYVLRFRQVGAPSIGCTEEVRLPADVDPKLEADHVLRSRGLVLYEGAPR